MSGWIKFEKDLESDPRVLRMARELKRSCNAMPFHPVTLVCGGLIRMWSYADSHIRENDTLDMGEDELDEVIGIPGFCALLPDDWLRVVDEHTVELPGFQEHNGVEARKKDLTNKRVQRHREKQKRTSVTPALPDQTRPDQTKTRPEEADMSAAPPRKRKVSRGTQPDPEWLLDFKLAYPERAGDHGWREAIGQANTRISEGHTPEEFIEGAKRYAAYCQATDSTGTQYVKQAKAFLGPEKFFTKQWAPPASKDQRKQNANIDASLEWLKQQEAADAAH